LEVYGKLYGMLKKIEERRKISLWSVSSHFTEKYRNSLGEGGYLKEKLDEGFHRGMAGGFPYYEMDLVDLPFIKEYYPFHLFSKNKENVRKLIEKAIENPEDTEDYEEEILVLHNKVYKEVVMMKLLNPFEAGGDIDGLEDLILGEPFGDLFMSRWKDKIINKIGEDEIINKLGEERIINKLGKDKIIDKLGEDEITKALLNKIGKKKLLELLDKLEQD